jgi:hypothetical protein
MSGLLDELSTQPVLLAEVDGLIVAEPLRFISLNSMAATRRHLVRRKNENLVRAQSVHADLTTQTGVQHHGA